MCKTGETKTSVKTAGWATGRGGAEGEVGRLYLRAQQSRDFSRDDVSLLQRVGTKRSGWESQVRTETNDGNPGSKTPQGPGGDSPAGTLSR